MVKYNRKKRRKNAMSSQNTLQLRVGLTLKNSWVDEKERVPYSTSVCLARSSAELMGVTIRSTVRKAARLAV